MNSKYLIYVCTRMCMSVPRVDNRATNTGESVNTQLFAWVGVSLCVHRQNGSIFYNLMYSVCVCGACVCVCVRVTEIHWPDSSSWGSAHIPVITTSPTADWLLSALLQTVSQSHCWSQAKVNTLQWCWQQKLTTDDIWHLWPHLHCTSQHYWVTCGISKVWKSFSSLWISGWMNQWPSITGAERIVSATMITVGRYDMFEIRLGWMDHYLCDNGKCN